MSDARAVSPCIAVCVLDPRGYCRGCLRTMAEIAAWARLTPAERQQVLDALPARRAELGCRPK